jgi:uncharacterized membrane protein
MPFVVSYLVALGAYVVMDAVWLLVTSKPLYRAALGDMLLPNLNAIPAVVFYLVYPIGLLVFAIAPALRSGTLLSAAVYGALFGVLAYGTYDLTNFATLKNWTLQITIADMIWGAFASATVCVVATYVARHFA